MVVIAIVAETRVGSLPLPRSVEHGRETAGLHTGEVVRGVRCGTATGQAILGLVVRSAPTALLIVSIHSFDLRFLNSNSVFAYDIISYLLVFFSCWIRY